MDLFAQVDAYCERMGPEFWAEPWNAVTNAAFLVAALWIWARAPFVVCRVLAAILGAIGVGSFLFHTHATVWAGITDVVPIIVFILTYIWAAHRYFWGLSPLWAGVSLLGVVPFAALTGVAFGALPFFTISAAYWPVALLIALEAWLMRHRVPDVAKGMGLGAALLAVSLTFRSLDMMVCAHVPHGSHFIWHLLNGLMLGWMIEVLRAHLAQPQRQG